MTARGRAAALVFAASALAFGVSPVRQLSDSYYSLLLAQQLATRGSFDLAEHFRGELAPDRFPGMRPDGLPYQVKRRGERVLGFYPPGAALLATPWMAPAAPLGLGVLDADGRYEPRRERRHQRVLAALLSAAFVAGLFAAADRVLPRRWAVGLAGAIALATPVWSSASRGLWSQTAALALCGGMLPLLVARESGERRGAFRLGLLAGAAWTCRPTLALVAVLVGGDLLLRDRRGAARFAAGAALPAALLVAHARTVWGSWLPPYYTASTFEAPTLERLGLVLLSPSRGLLIFEPALVVALAFAVVARRSLAMPRLAVLGGLGLGLHALLVASWSMWWGGHGYGPRLFTETVFFQALAAIPVAVALAAVRPERRGRAWRRAFAVSLALGAAIHGAGALAQQSNLWNRLPRDVDEAPARLLDWGDPQFLAWANRAPRRGATIGNPQSGPP